MYSRKLLSTLAEPKLKIIPSVLVELTLRLPGAVGGLVSRAKATEVATLPSTVPSFGVSLKYISVSSVSDTSKPTSHTIVKSTEPSLSVSMSESVPGVDVTTPSPSPPDCVTLTVLLAVSQVLLSREYSIVKDVTSESVSATVVVTVTAEAEVWTGVEDEINNSINIYPNPVKDNLFIEGQYDYLDIFDLFGRLLISSNAKTEIDVSKLSSGTYVLEIISNNIKRSEKIIISK